ncbi:hypothetical protein NHX12_001831 [Muraenolepis orangiensis]|uniref:Cilia- and flagella-associated protein 418 n=1 Tax=Muraenolepis orangiensis TaxID=630683 RepID=A0A9Q0E0F5_9TELE|nr:hypothetical protein NHX12_001831 [Muraenolepis orangiensis]
MAVLMYSTGSSVLLAKKKTAVGVAWPRKSTQPSQTTEPQASLLSLYLSSVTLRQQLDYEKFASFAESDVCNAAVRTGLDSDVSNGGSEDECAMPFVSEPQSRSGRPSTGQSVESRLVWSCDQLRCTSCDFRVLMFEDQEWDSSCDYLFLRNNMPDRERLRAKLRRSRGRRAYACQCSWFSARDPAELGRHPQLRWVCGKHPA